MRIYELPCERILLCCFIPQLSIFMTEIFAYFVGMKNIRIVAVFIGKGLGNGALFFELKIRLP